MSDTVTTSETTPQSSPAHPPTPTPLLSVIIPTYNERANIERLLQELNDSFRREGIDAEIIVVDDNSPDGTGDLLDELRRQYPNLRVLHRAGKMGLATAVIDGFARAQGTLFAVMDADLSHPPEVMSKLALALTSGEADLAIGTRYMPSGGSAGWDWHRKVISRVATWFARPLTPVNDPGSGFFALRRSVIEDVTLSPIGFKILLEILVKGHYLHVEEVPFIFANRAGGKSKMGLKEIAAYLRHCLRLYLWRLSSR